MERSPAKIEVRQNAEWAFGLIREQLFALEKDLHSRLEKIYKKGVVKLIEKSPLDLEFHICDDIIIFSLHTDAFTFPEGHPVWKNSSVAADRTQGYFGMISIYNFLTDSIKFHRVNDQGILVSRIYIDRSQRFFMEGKRQLGVLYNDVSGVPMDGQASRIIAETIIAYCLDFDIVMPSFDAVRIISVQEMIEKSLSTVVGTGKRLGFKLQTDSEVD